MPKGRLRTMTDHEVTQEWLDEILHLVAITPESAYQHVEQQLRATRELNRRHRATRGVQGWCTCATCFHWWTSTAEVDIDLLQDYRRGREGLLGGDGS
jgi:hypothetical protein